MSLNLDRFGVSQTPNVDGFGMYIPGSASDIPADPVFYASFSQNTTVAETGQTMVLGSSDFGVSFVEWQGIPCVYSPPATFESQYHGFFHIAADSPQTLTGSVNVNSNAAALSFWFYNTSNDTNRGLVACFHEGHVKCCAEDGYQLHVGFAWGQEDWRNLYLDDRQYINAWTHVLINCIAGVAYVYINGILKGNISLLSSSTGLPQDLNFCGSWNGNGSDGNHLEGYAAAYRLYDHSLTAVQINALANEFTPVT